MPVRTDCRERGGRGRTLWVLLLPAMLLLGACAKDLCKSKELTRDQLCNCQPRDNELLARLQPTDLPYPLQRVVLRCAGEIRSRSAQNVVTKQTLVECVNADSGLDGPTKASLGSVINGSNLMEQKQVDDWHSQCLNTGTATVPVSPTAPATTDAAAATTAPAPVVPATAPATAPPKNPK